MGSRSALTRCCKMTAIAFAAAILHLLSGSTNAASVADFQKTIQPILSRYCFDCHGDGANKGQVALDQFKTDADITKNPELWWKVLKNVRSGLMPPLKKDRPDDEETQQLFNWIKHSA